MAYHQHICALAAVISCALACFGCQAASSTEPKRILLLRYSVGYSDLLARNARAELERQSPSILQIYDALFTAGRVGDENTLARYADYLGSLFPDQRLDLAVTVGSPAVTFFQRYGRQLFPATPMLAVARESRLPSNLGQLETGAALSIDLVEAIDSILLLQLTKVRLFDEGGLDELFNHLKNLLTATLIISAGSYGIREAATVELFGAPDVELAGYFVVAIGALLAALNALKGLHQLNKQRWHIGFRIVAIVLYFVGAMRVIQLLVALRNG
jgi:hypothetical protein